MSTSLWRTLRNVYQSGLRRAGWQIQVHNDTKPAGVLRGVDDFGNKFYETDERTEIFLRSRWVEYNEWGVDISKVEPGWHYWLGYGTNTPPNQVEGSEKATRAYPLPNKHKDNKTNTPGAYVAYNTAKPKCHAWEPKVAARV
ncbi:hypothetical protein DIURU_003993 [Diutina rugosa]|uniref:NADH dehydrogenase [ubiquinone] 1 alpha subcomplex subunit n=1 Tax=Diutina rugosa TaxID=5481 RepID=A0A642UJ80_DIURU|nr:uncharacterized protein DIURU_003993 [Diutina rugosa]KAA8900045.1 hypothetical protein DIURU_003993 [Diutina rugosa]